jgi:hypothetical protein
MCNDRINIAGGKIIKFYGDVKNGKENAEKPFWSGCSEMRTFRYWNTDIDLEICYKFEQIKTRGIPDLLR